LREVVGRALGTLAYLPVESPLSVVDWVSRTNRLVLFLESSDLLGMLASLLDVGRSHSDKVMVRWPGIV